MSFDQRFGFGSQEIENARKLIAMALSEDRQEAGDVTSLATIPAETTGSAKIVARAEGVLAGVPLIPLMIEAMGAKLTWMGDISDGERLSRDLVVGTLSGSMRDLLALERPALNFLQRLSGIASLTARFVQEIEGTSARVLDTRKTTPGWRHLEKYAVRCGGGINHRMSLSDMILIKDNHLAALGGDIALAVKSARALCREGQKVELEVDSLEQFDEGLSAQPDIILVDNLGPESLSEAVKRRNLRAPEILLEASGGVRLDTIRAIALSGVDRISVGALTHSAPALDLGLDFGEVLT